MRTILFAAAVAALAFGGAAAEGCTPTTSTPALTFHWVGGHGAYVVAEVAGPALLVYEEGNGIAGLQRSDELHDDTCGGQIPGDTLVG